MAKKSVPGDGGGHGLGSKGGLTFSEPVRGVRGLVTRVRRIATGASVTQ